MFLRMNLDYPKRCLGHPFSKRVIERTTIFSKIQNFPTSSYWGCDIMNFVAGNYLLNLRRHSYWWSRTIWFNIRFIRFSVWAVKVSKIQIFKFYDKIVKAIIMGIFVANKTRQLGNSIEVKNESWLPRDEFKKLLPKFRNFRRNRIFDRTSPKN